MTNLTRLVGPTATWWASSIRLFLYLPSTRFLLSFFFYIFVVNEVLAEFFFASTSSFEDYFFFRSNIPFSGGPGQWLLDDKRVDQSSVPRFGQRRRRYCVHNLTIVRAGEGLWTWSCLLEHPERPRVWNAFLQQVTKLEISALCVVHFFVLMVSNCRWREWCGLSVMKRWPDLLEVNSIIIQGKEKYIGCF